MHYNLTSFVVEAVLVGVVSIVSYKMGRESIVRKAIRRGVFIGKHFERDGWNEDAMEEMMDEAASDML